MLFIIETVMECKKYIRCREYNCKLNNKRLFLLIIYIKSIDIPKSYLKFSANISIALAIEFENLAYE